MGVGHFFNYICEVIIGLYFAVIILFDLIWNIIRHPIKSFNNVWPKDKDVVPACLNDPTLGSHGFIRLEEVRLHYVASGDESKPLMLFIHGFPEFWYSWRHQIREFKNDYRVVAFDMRGYADSDKPKGVPAYKTEKLIEDVKQLITALGYSTCTLVALDWGSIIAYMFAAKHQDMIDRLITMNGPHFGTLKDFVKTHKSETKKFWYASFFQIPWIPELMFKVLDFKTVMEKLGGVKDVTAISDSDLVAYRYAFLRPGALTGSINYYRALRRYPPGKSILNTIGKPTLIIWGCQDSILHKDLAQLPSKFIPNLAVKYVEDAGHFVMMEKPDEVNKIMRDWLST